MHQSVIWFVQNKNKNVYCITSITASKRHHWNASAIRDHRRFCVHHRLNGIMKYLLLPAVTLDFNLMASLVHEHGHALELGLLNPIKEKYTPRGGNNLCPILTISNFIEQNVFATQRKELAAEIIFLSLSSWLPVVLNIPDWKMVEIDPLE